MRGHTVDLWLAVAWASLVGTLIYGLFFAFG